MQPRWSWMTTTQVGSGFKGLKRSQFCGNSDHTMACHSGLSDPDQTLLSDSIGCWLLMMVVMQVPCLLRESSLCTTPFSMPTCLEHRVSPLVSTCCISQHSPSLSSNPMLASCRHEAAGPAPAHWGCGGCHLWGGCDQGGPELGQRGAHKAAG